MAQVRTAKAFEAFVAAATHRFPVVRELALGALPSEVLPPGWQAHHKMYMLCGGEVEAPWIHLYSSSPQCSNGVLRVCVCSPFPGGAQCVGQSTQAPLPTHETRKAKGEEAWEESFKEREQIQRRGRCYWELVAFRAPEGSPEGPFPCGLVRVFFAGRRGR